MEEFVEEKNIPEKKFSCGGVMATVWKNNGTSKSGDAVSYRTVSFQRRYKDKSGDWKTSYNLRINDLPKASLVIDKAFEFLVLKDPSEE